jgi:hypothetical protein
VYFFFPETRYRSLEEMDDIFKKSTNIFDANSNQSTSKMPCAAEAFLCMLLLLRKVTAMTV